MSFIFQFVILIFLSLAIVSPSWGSDAGVDKLKQEAIKKMKARRTGFEKFLHRREEWERKRLSRADEQKKIRAKQARELEQARRNFHRPQDNFPHQAYKKFINQRDERRLSAEKARKAFGKMSKELNKIYEDKEYKIDGNKEYDL